MYTLCVVDMQNEFKVQPYTRVADNSAREINKAVQDNANVIFVEYRGCGPTIEQLIKITRDIAYPRTYRVEKPGDDGSRPIIGEMRKHGLPDHHIKVVGVNTDCCVYRTVYGLKCDLPFATIEVVGDACDSFWDPNAHQTGLKRIQDLGCQVS